ALRAGVDEGLLRAVGRAPAGLARGVEHDVGRHTGILVERTARHAHRAVAGADRRHATAGRTEAAPVAGRRLVARDTVLAGKPAEAVALHLQVDAVRAARDLAAVRAVAGDRHDDAVVVELERDGAAQARSLRHENLRRAGADDVPRPPF